MRADERRCPEHSVRGCRLASPGERGSIRLAIMIHDCAAVCFIPRWASASCFVLASAPAANDVSRNASMDMLRCVGFGGPRHLTRTAVDVSPGAVQKHDEQSGRSGILFSRCEMRNAASGRSTCEGMGMATKCGMKRRPLWLQFSSRSRGWNCRMQ
jgi:hypothetical protein